MASATETISSVATPVNVSGSIGRRFARLVNTTDHQATPAPNPDVASPFTVPQEALGLTRRPREFLPVLVVDRVKRPEQD